MNSVSKQNSKQAINMLAAQRAIYSRAKVYWGAVIVMSGLALPLISVYSIFNKYYAAYAALLSFGILFLNGLVLITIKRMVTNAAAIQDLFDSYVLDVPKNYILIPSDVNELISEWSAVYFKKHDKSQITDWYAASLRQMGQTKATLTGQSINAWWDGSLRQAYLTGQVTIAGFIILSVLTLGLMQNLSLEDFILAILVPVIPLVQIILSELYKNYVATQGARKNLDKAQGLLNNSTASKVEIRMLQDSIYLHRVSSPLVFDFIYWLSQKKKELTMINSNRA
jgi:hypothetical protein